MDRWKGRVALVTGASVGIGAATAKELVRFGMKVVGCARDVEKIKSLAAECQSAGYGGVLIPFKCDLTNVDEIQSMFADIKAQHDGVDVCINNAGLAHPEPLLSGKTSAWKNMLDVRMVLIRLDQREVWLLIPRPRFSFIYFFLTISQVNIVALSICTREAYQSMKERKIDDGHIINLNSMCGHRVLPNADIHFYTGTKYAVTALTEGLRQELRDAKTHIRATCISPGLVETEFAPRLYSLNAEKAASVYSYYKALEAIDVANAIVYVLSAPPHVQIGDIQMRSVEQVS